jgi:hypothetical protein
MVKLIFKYDYLKDSKNLWESINDPFLKRKVTFLLDKRTLNKIKNKKWENICLWFPLKIKKVYIQNKKLINKILETYFLLWKEKENDLLELLNKIFNKKINLKKVIAYLTLCTRCQYDPTRNYFMVSFFSSPTQLLYTCIHELFHLQFYHNYYKICKKYLNFEEFLEFSELMAVIVDTELKDFLFIKEKRNINKLRKKIRNLWLENKNIDKIIAKSLFLFKHQDKVS